MSNSSSSADRLLTALTTVSQNYSWVWTQSHRDVLTRALGNNWGTAGHPFAALQQICPEKLAELSADYGYLQECETQASAVQLLEATNSGEAANHPDVAYFSPEFGISETLPQYSGGLGILAGDHLKAVSDLGLPLVGVGLFYANGYFDQGLANGTQTVSYEAYEPSDLGLTNTGVEVSVETPQGPIAASVWLAKIGSTRLYMLDSRVSGNGSRAAAVTDRLYGGDQSHRLDQEWLLGIGGLRALKALGIKPKTFHLNEGHAGFLILELINDRMAQGDSLDEAQESVKSRTLFTTHTPVPAGIDRFPKSLLKPYLNQWAARIKTIQTGTADSIWASGELPSETEGDLFNMAAFCLRHAGLSNGVSALHGTVSQSLFGSLDEGSNITSITNGVHARTWMASAAQDLIEHHVGAQFASANENAWQAAGGIKDTEIRDLRNGLRSDLVHYLDQEHGFSGFDPGVLTVGFARRFATYKRAALLLRERSALVELLNNDDAPIQFVFAGKAHPADQEGQRIFSEIAEFGASAEANGRFILVPGYDIDVASHLYGGCDIWLNNPVRPQEACGTSGEKSALNGGLNCSILDGWWAEWFDAKNGWAIETSDEPDPEKRDATEALGLVKLLAEEIIPLFYNDQPAWTQRIRFGWQHLGPRVTAARMVADYNSQLYQPLCTTSRD